MGCISTMCIYILYIYIFIMEILFHIQQIVTAKHYFLYSGEQHIILYIHIYIFPRISRVVCHSLRFPPHQSTRGFDLGAVIVQHGTYTSGKHDGFWTRQ